MNTYLRFAIGVVTFGVGVGMLASLPIIPTPAALISGWVLLVTGAAIAAGPLLDLIGVE